jgi:hypothetical protein
MSHQQQMQSYVNNYSNISKLFEKAKRNNHNYETLKGWFDDNIILISLASNGHIESTNSLESAGFTKSSIIQTISSHAHVAYMNMQHTLSRR